MRLYLIGLLLLPVLMGAGPHSNAERRFNALLDRLDKIVAFEEQRMRDEQERTAALAIATAEFAEDLWSDSVIELLGDTLKPPPLRNAAGQLTVAGLIAELEKIEDKSVAVMSLPGDLLTDLLESEPVPDTRPAE